MNYLISLCLKDGTVLHTVAADDRPTEDELDTLVELHACDFADICRQSDDPPTTRVEH